MRGSLLPAISGTLSHNFAEGDHVGPMRVLFRAVISLVSCLAVMASMT